MQGREKNQQPTARTLMDAPEYILDECIIME